MANQKKDRNDNEEKRLKWASVAHSLRTYADLLESEDHPMRIMDFSQNLEFDDFHDDQRGESTHISFTVFEPLPQDDV